MHRYGYDRVYQLTDTEYPSSREMDYNYDVLGNRWRVVDDGSTTAYVDNSQGLNQYGSVGADSVTYDDNGNLIDDGDLRVLL